MKLFGIRIEGPNTDFLVFSRPNGDVLIRAQAILDEKPFFLMCPRPKPPTIQRPGQKPEGDDTDPGYIQQLNNWAKQKTDWLIVESLKTTEGLEWDTVNYEDPSTWKNWNTELTDAGFTEVDKGKIIGLVFSVNGLNEDMMTQARERFLAGRARELKRPSSPNTEPTITPSGEPVKDSE